MKEIKYVITDPLGMHARPAGMLVKAVAPFASKITVAAPTGTADAKRLMAPPNNLLSKNLLFVSTSLHLMVSRF